MSTSRSLFLSVALSSLVFSAAALPLVMLGSRSITVEVEEKPLLTGRIQDLASPYLGLAFGLSAGVGIVALSLGEWRATSRRLNQARDRVSDLERQLQKQENQVESLKFAESRLQSQGLSFFLDPANSTVPATAPLHAVHTASTPVFAPAHENAAQVTHTAIVQESSSQNQATPQIEEVMTALKHLVSQVEQLQSGNSKGGIGTVNASVRA